MHDELKQQADEIHRLVRELNSQAMTAANMGLNVKFTTFEHRAVSAGSHDYLAVSVSMRL